MPMFPDQSKNLTGIASAADDLALGGSMTPEQIALRKKKIMAAGGTDPMMKYGSAAFALLGQRGSGAPM